MPISFNTIPASIRDPGVYAEIDNSRALRGLPIFKKKVFLIGQKLSTGSATALKPILVTSSEQADKFFGRGSQLSQMLKTFKKNTTYIETWAIPLVDDAGGTQATGNIVFSGPATANGTLFLYIAGTQIKVPVTSGDSSATIATNTVARISANGDLPVTAVVNGGNTSKVDFTARHKGTLGNEIDIRFNYYGSDGGEFLPTSVGATITAMSGGATDPNYQTALDVLPEEIVDFICVGTNASGEIAKIENELDARWGYDKNYYGMGFYAKQATVANLSTYGNARNNSKSTCMGFYDSPTPFWSWASAYAAQSAVSATNDPARPVQTLILKGVLAPPLTSRFTATERDTLLYDGISTYKVDRDGTVRISRGITTYQTNAVGAQDPSYLDIETIFTLAYLQESARTRLLLRFPRHKLADDGTRYGAGQAIVTPSIVKAELIALFAQWEEVGLVENRKQFIAELIVERNVSDPNRLDVQMPPDLINQLRITALQIQFLL